MTGISQNITARMGAGYLLSWPARAVCKAAIAKQIKKCVKMAIKPFSKLTDWPHRIRKKGHTPWGAIPFSPLLRRGGRVAEGGGLLNRWRRKLLPGVRIPSPPPFPYFHLYQLVFFVCFRKEIIGRCFCMREDVWKTRFSFCINILQLKEGLRNSPPVIC